MADTHVVANRYGLDTAPQEEFIGDGIRSVDQDLSPQAVKPSAEIPNLILAGSIGFIIAALLMAR